MSRDQVEFREAPFLLKLISLSVSASETAGKLISGVISDGNLKVVNKASKGSFDPQTEADRLSQLCLTAKLKQYFPKLKIIGEEGDITGDVSEDLMSNIIPNEDVLKKECPLDLKDLDEESVVVWIDPLDGTKGFVYGYLNQVTVLIGIATKDGRSIAGVVHQPFCCDIAVSQSSQGMDRKFMYSRTVWGVVGLGIFGLKSRAKFRASDSVCLISQNHYKSLDLKLGNILKMKDLIKSSGAAFKALCVIEGEADVLVYTSGGTKKWDTCAIDAFFTIVGGSMTDLYGTKINYSADSEHPNTLGVLASINNHETYISAIRADFLK